MFLFGNQEQIFEIDESKFGKRKYNITDMQDEVQSGCRGFDRATSANFMAHGSFRQWIDFYMVEISPALT